MSLDTLPDVLTVKELCEVLRISRAHAYRLIHDGKIPALPLEGRVVRVAKRTVEQYLGLTDASRVVRDLSMQ